MPSSSGRVQLHQAEDGKWACQDALSFHIYLSCDSVVVVICLSSHIIQLSSFSAMTLSITELHKIILAHFFVCKRVMSFPYSLSFTHKNTTESHCSLLKAWLICYCMTLIEIKFRKFPSISISWNNLRSIDVNWS